MVARTIVELVVESFDFMVFGLFQWQLNHVLHICPIGNLSHSSLFNWQKLCPISANSTVSNRIGDTQDTDIVFSVSFTCKYV